ncbi:MAG: hypothetical protein ABJA82_18550, partial [Myxococcales bacterium]
FIVAMAGIGGCSSSGGKPLAGERGTGGGGGSTVLGSGGRGTTDDGGATGGATTPPPSEADASHASTNSDAGASGGVPAATGTTDGGGTGGATTGPPSETDASMASDAGADGGGTAAEAGRTDGARTSTFSFFVTSTGTGTMGGNLGGLAGADMKCQTLAAASGAGARTWHSYLSLSAANGQPAVNARDRIGKGPWFNVKGARIADDLDKLHEVGGAMNGIGPETSLDEKGSVVPNIVNKIAPNQHDVLTGTALDGTALPATPDRTCAGWTSNASSGVTAQVGHVDRTGNVKTPAENYPWNSSHYTPGCAADQLLQVGGTGRLYCFAID